MRPNKIKPGPWMLSDTASAQADRPRTACHKATRESGAKALSAGQRDGGTVAEQQAPSSPWPTQHADVSRPRNKTKDARASKYSPRRRTTPTDELSHPLGQHPGAPGGCTAPTDHVKGENRQNTLWSNPLTRPKPRGLLLGATIRDTLNCGTKTTFKNTNSRYDD